MKLSLKNGLFLQSILLIVIYLLGLIGGPYLTNKFLNNKELSVSVKISLIFSVVTLLFIILFAFKNKINNLEMDRSTNIRAIGYGIIGFVIMMMLQFILGIILLILSKIFNFDYTSQNTAFLTELIRAYPIYLFMPIIFAPIVEELVFRKAIFGYFYDVLNGSNKVLRFLIPATLSGIIFALPHDGLSPIMIVYVIMSYVFSGIYLYTKNILTPITAHLLMNTAVVILQLLGNQNY